MITQNNRAISVQSLVALVFALFFIVSLVHLLNQFDRTVSIGHIAKEYFPSTPSSENAAITTNTKGTNPLLTEEGLKNFILENSAARDQYTADFSGLREVCKNTVWQQNIYFYCVRNVSGLFNAYNSALNCLRYAIAAGASGLVIPKIEKRDPQDLSKIRSGKYENLDYVFDVGKFKNVMLSHCLELKLYEDMENILGYGAATITPPLSMRKVMGQEAVPGWRNEKASEFRGKFDEWVKSFEKEPSEESPIIVRLNDKMLYSYPPATDDSTFASNFGFVYEFRRDLVTLATIITERLRSSSMAGNATVRVGEKDGNSTASGYIGVHMRTGNDTPDHWPKWDYPTRAIEMAVESGLKLIYVGTGDEEGFRKLSKQAAASGILAVDKWRMMSNNEKEFLMRFEFDQVAIIDYLVLMSADRFLGTSRSSYSANLALRREFLHTGQIWPGGNTERNELLGGKFPFHDMMWP